MYLSGGPGGAGVVEMIDVLLEVPRLTREFTTAVVRVFPAASVIRARISAGPSGAVVESHVPE